MVVCPQLSGVIALGLCRRTVFPCCFHKEIPRCLHQRTTVSRSAASRTGVVPVILVPATISLVRAPHVAPVVGSINVAAGLLFVLLAICVAHNGRRMRLIGWMSLSALLTGAVLIGVLTWTDAAEGLEASVWADGGRRHGYLPLLLPILATGWMWLSNPRRIVINAERMDELGATLAERTRTAQSGRD